MAATLGFLGRTSECELLDQLLASARGGHSSVVVVRGEAGIGKTALLQYAVGRASDFHVAQIAGVEAEMELPFAGLHQLCAPLLARADAIPEPQRDALSVALGVAFGPAPDPFLVALAVLSLLSAVAEEQPLLCIVDDAQWLDAASSHALAFVARRLLAESVAIVLAVRDPHVRPEFKGLPDLTVGRLDARSGEALLTRAIPGRLDDQVRQRIVAETRGNPLALLELPRGMTAVELSGGFELPAAADLSGPLEDRYVQRIRELPDATQQLLLLAAADPVGDATLLWRAAAKLSIAITALTPAAEAQLLEIGARVSFRHPLVRSAVYRAAPLDDRRSAHEALAEVSDPDADADRRAWHRALAAPEPDEGVAAELERSAGCAQMRGGIAAAAAFLERAAGLTVDPAHRARRTLAAAQAKHQAGAPEAARALLASAQAGPLDALQRAQVDLMRALIAFTSNRGNDAPPLLLGAAKQLESLNVPLARETYLDALMAAQLAGRFAPGAVQDVGQAARDAPPAPASRPPDLLLDGLATLITEGHSAAAPLLRQAVNAFRAPDVVATGGFRWLFLAEMAAIELWDFDAWRELTVREVQLVREAGALTVLATALSVSIYIRIFAGELAGAGSLLDEQRIVTEASGGQLGPHAALILTAWRGREAELTALIETTVSEVEARGEGLGLSATQWVNALLHNALGNYETALASALQLMDPPRPYDQAIGWALPELIEAAVRTGQESVARDGLAQLVEMTRGGGTDWGLGIEARSRALLSEPSLAEPLYLEAIKRLGRTPLRGEHARAHLLYGEWLRRQGRRANARDQLRTAHGMFAEMGMEAFADRTRRELLAAGGAVGGQQDVTRQELTMQEEQISRFARDGLSNPEIGARLFLSPRTVEWHLRNVFAKLGITSRRDLAAALPDPPRSTPRRALEMS
jgi:DNA-binding CsgD family transcriptional regulator